MLLLAALIITAVLGFVVVPYFVGIAIMRAQHRARRLRGEEEDVDTGARPGAAD